MIRHLATYEVKILSIPVCLTELNGRVDQEVVTTASMYVYR